MAKIAIVFVSYSDNPAGRNMLTSTTFSIRCTATSSSWPRLRRRVSRLPVARPTSSSKMMSCVALIHIGTDTEPCRIAETLPEEVLSKMYAPPKSSYPVATPATLLEYDAVLFGIPTRYGNFPAQWKTFWDSTGQQWATGGYYGKYAGVFVSTASPGGGQESTAIASMSTLAHHGFNFVPLGYKHTFGQLTNLSEVHGGSPWGAGTFVSFLLFRTLCLRIRRYRMLMQNDRPLVTAAASPLLWSSRSPRFRVRPSMPPFPRSTSLDYMVAVRRRRSLLRQLGSSRRTRRTRRPRKGHVACRRSAIFSRCIHIPI